MLDAPVIGALFRGALRNLGRIAGRYSQTDKLEQGATVNQTRFNNGICESI
jgi:hypothetical protein